MHTREFKVGQNEPNLLHCKTFFFVIVKIAARVIAFLAALNFRLSLQYFVSCSRFVHFFFYRANNVICANVRQTKWRKKKKNGALVEFICTKTNKKQKMMETKSIEDTHLQNVCLCTIVHGSNVSDSLVKCICIFNCIFFLCSPSIKIGLGKICISPIQAHCRNEQAAASNWLAHLEEKNKMFYILCALPSKSLHHHPYRYTYTEVLTISVFPL